MKEYRIQADGGKELAISRWPNGKYSIKVFSSLGQMVAQLILPTEEGEKLRDALDDLGFDDVLMENAERVSV